MPKKPEYNTRPCKRCGVDVIDVRDAFTGATFPVEAVFDVVPGVVLGPAENGRRNPLAQRADVFYPHLPRCTSPEPAGLDEEAHHLLALQEER